MPGICPICNNEFPEDASSCPTCGFHIGGSTKKFEPVSVEPHEPLESSPASSTQKQVLKVVRGSQTGIEITLSEGTMTLGRDPRCDIFLNDMTVSRKHAELQVKTDSCILRDKNSFNGVWVNDRAIETCLLKPGDLIQIGAFSLQYRKR